MLKSFLLGWVLCLAVVAQAQDLIGPQAQPTGVDFTWIDTVQTLKVEVADSVAPKPQVKVPSYFQLSDDLAIDCVWINQHQYFNLWTSQKINPYNLDGAKYGDTLDVSIADGQDKWAFPITDTRITSPFGFRRYRWHYGTDLKLYYGDTVAAAFDGIVRIVDYERYGYGRYVVLRHLNGLETLYGHLSKAKVKVGDVVSAGDLIGLGGSTGRSTGTHLHFEIRYQGNAIDPTAIFNFTEECLVEASYQVTPASFTYLKEARKVRYHRIRRGETLSHISRRYGVSINRLCRLNGIGRKTILRIGRRLRIS